MTTRGIGDSLGAAPGGSEFVEEDGESVAASGEVLGDVGTCTGEGVAGGVRGAVDVCVIADVADIEEVGEPVGSGVLFVESVLEIDAGGEREPVGSCDLLVDAVLELDAGTVEDGVCGPDAVVDGLAPVDSVAEGVPVLLRVGEGVGVPD